MLTPYCRNLVTFQTIKMTFFLCDGVLATAAT
jgi:hypothetical protein